MQLVNHSSETTGVGLCIFVQLPDPPTESVSSLSFSPNGKHLVATSWDCQVGCWAILSKRSAVKKGTTSHDHPVLCSTWRNDGSSVFSGGCEKLVKEWPMDSTHPVTVGRHDAPVKEIAWIPQWQLLVTGSWDRTLGYWDIKQSNPVHIQQLPECCYALSVQGNWMFVGTADGNFIIFDLQNPQIELKRISSLIPYQTRCVAAFPDEQGFLAGSIGGMVGIHHLDDSEEKKNITFKCHRDVEKIYSINSLNFHPVYPTFASAGSDGFINFWDKDTNMRLNAMARSAQPITCCAFNNNGSRFAYAVGYDWSRGAENHNPAEAKNHIFIHKPAESWVKPMTRGATRGKRRKA